MFNVSSLLEDKFRRQWSFFGFIHMWAARKILALPKETYCFRNRMTAVQFLWKVGDLWKKLCLLSSSPPPHCLHRCLRFRKRPFSLCCENTKGFSIKLVCHSAQRYCSVSSVIQMESKVKMIWSREIACTWLQKISKLVKNSFSLQLKRTWSLKNSKSSIFGAHLRCSHKHNEMDRRIESE